VLQEQGIDQDKAQRLIDSFLERFPGGVHSPNAEITAAC
jgi:hypothetical protein